jgi:hypothetical protein
MKNKIPYSINISGYLSFKQISIKSGLYSPQEFFQTKFLIKKSYFNLIK